MRSQVPILADGIDQAMTLGVGHDRVRCLCPTDETILQTYDPLRYRPDLYRAFAATSETAVGVMEFATVNGLLGIGLEVEDESGEQLLVESEEEWITEIRALANVLRHVDALRNLLSQEDFSLLMTASQTEHFEALVRRKGPAQRARVLKKLWREFMIRTVNEHLHRNVGHVAVAVDESQGQILLTQQPTTLLGALWLQCAGAVTGKRDFRQCRHPACGEWFEVSESSRGTKAKRIDARFHSDLCRASYAQRCRKEAKRLKREGKSRAQIAEELGEPPSRVRTWLARQAPPKR